MNVYQYAQFIAIKLILQYCLWAASEMLISKRHAGASEESLDGITQFIGKMRYHLLHMDKLESIAVKNNEIGGK